MKTRHTRRLSRLLTVVTIAAAALTACSSTTPGGSTSSDSGSAQSLTIYTARDSGEVSAVLAAFQAANPQYQGKVQAVNIPTGDALTRLESEKSNPQAGFLWGGTNAQFVTATQQGLLSPYKMQNDALISAADKDPDYNWYAEMLYPEVIVYNSNLLNADTAPKDWSDLGTPAWKGKLVMRDVMPSGTMQTIFSSMIYSYFQTDGKPDRGYDFLAQVDANTVDYTQTPADMYTALDQGTGSVTVWNLQDVMIQTHVTNPPLPWGYVMPASGSPILLDCVGIVNNPKQQTAAQAFMDFLMSPAEQATLSTQYYQIPAMQLPASSQADWLSALTIKPMDIDWNVLNSNENTWMTYWANNIKGKNGGQ